MLKISQDVHYVHVQLLPFTEQVSLCLLIACILDQDDLDHWQLWAVTKYFISVLLLIQF